MDSIILDVGALPAGALKVGDRVELLGPNRLLDTVADEAGTITHEILARLGPRLRRVYIGEVA
jgi:alanine racemase